MLDNQPLGEYPELDPMPSVVYSPGPLWMYTTKEYELSPLVRPAYEAYQRGELKPYQRRPQLRSESVYEQNLPPWN
ncbi:hypothetical protein BKG82_23090 [Mycobacteroides chelonae]|uniref:Uncharacterized protein n=1 Tax=Mycobacteroides chelonae TaxID=1774 RepID=A0A1S1LMF4_MYCCH|nr:hypothetical protein [Mycobacteroides chelonae]OHU51485.1 hypothetical protein BKG82_23090 [Mycobacteroides chelonae]